ncbi:tyrosine-type recombinase/integrase, partial [Streptomyces sp. NPDC050485]|uniref:tyrosine-type recombinase/integrase n=1 Tax=Streptomyces sp. NPDC050485 TaxID=3365617 RepID=UPI00378E63FE
MPSGSRYWTVVDDQLQVLPVADRYLRDLRFGRSRAELTTKSYAGAIALYMRWCRRTDRDWSTAAADMGLFIVWLKYSSGGVSKVVVAGPGVDPVRRERRINGVLTGVRGFLAHAVAAKEAPGWVLGQLYEIASTQDLPLEAQGEDTGVGYRLGARHRLQEPETEVDRATDEEIVALLHACRSARDRLSILVMARVGLRVGQLAGLRRCDAHLMVDSRILGCDVEGPHLHVVRRQNPNTAWSKRRSSIWFPVDFLVVQAFDQYVYERHEFLGNDGSDFLLVNLFRPPLGSPVTPDAVGELVERLARRAGLEGHLTPHMLRRAFGSNVRVFTSAVDLRRGGVLEIASRAAGDRFPGLEAG